MATLGQILPRKFAAFPFIKIGSVDQYNTIEWDPSITDPLPSEADIRAYSSTVDSEIAAEQALQNQQDKLFAEYPDVFVRVIEMVADQMQEIRDNAVVAGLIVDWSDLDDLKALITKVRS